jgi:hypothetical protein
MPENVHTAPNKAENVAAVLAYEFLRDGKYSAAHGSVEVPSLLSAAGAVAATDETAVAAFGNLAVQSVGFDEGIPEPSVHIYLTQGSAKLIKSLPKEVDGVGIAAHRMGKLLIKPEAAATGTNPKTSKGLFGSLMSGRCEAQMGRSRCRETRAVWL